MLSEQIFPTQIWNQWQITSFVLFFFFLKGKKMKTGQAGRGVMVPMCRALLVPSSTSTSALPPAPLLDFSCWLQGLYTMWTSELPLAQERKNCGGFFPFTHLPKSFLLEHPAPSPCSLSGAKVSDGCFPLNNSLLSEISVKHREAPTYTMHLLASPSHLSLYSIRSS